MPQPDDEMKNNLTFSIIASILALSLSATSCKKNKQPQYRFVDDPSQNLQSQQKYPSPPVRQVKAYIHSDSTGVYTAPSEETALAAKLNAFEAITVSGNMNGEFVQVVQPVSGYVKRENLYDEDQMDRFAHQEIDWYNELNMVCHNQTPFAGLQTDSTIRDAYSLERHWADDDIHQIRYIRASGLDIYTKASKRADILGSLKKNQRIIIDTDYKPRSDWVKVVYPFSGYADKNSLYTNEHVCARLERQSYLVNKINEALGLEPLPVEGKVFAETKKQVARQTKPASTTKTVSQKVVVKPPVTASGGTRIITWEERQAQVSTQVSQPEVEQPAPPIRVETVKTTESDNRIQELQAELDALKNEIKELKKEERRSSGNKEEEAPSLVVPEEVQIEEQPAEESVKETEPDRTTPISIVSPKLVPDELDLGDWDAEAELDKELFSGIDSIVMLTYPQDNKWRISGIGAFAPYHIPVEKNFIKLGIPYGASVEAGKQNWPVSMGIGYNSMRALSKSQVYILDAREVNLYAKYTPFKLLKDQLELFVNAGVAGYQTSISNQKYPEHQDYYTPQAAQGIGYMGGAGALYEFKKFLFGLQYQHYGTPLVVMGPDLNEPNTQEELNDFIPTTQYKLYAGSHQFQVIIGYRIN